MESDNPARRRLRRRRLKSLALSAIWLGCVPLVAAGCADGETSAAQSSGSASVVGEPSASGSDEEPPASPEEPTATLVRPSKAPSASPAEAGPAGTEACTLFDAADFKQPGSPALPKPRQEEGWDSSCSWASMQFRAGYTPPPDVDRGDYGPGGEGDLGAASEAAGKLGEVLENSRWFDVRVAIRATPPPRPQAQSYTVGGRRFELMPPTADAPDTCATATAWGTGAVLVVVTDQTKVTPPCDSAKRLIALLVAKAPR